MGRIRIIEKPLAFLPKKCCVSGRGDGEIVDFGAECQGIDPHIYIKREIVEKAGKVCDMLTEAEAYILQEERASLIAENAELRRDAKAVGIHNRAEAAKLAYAGAAAASAVILEHNPEIELPNEAIIAAAEELVEPTKEEIVNT